MAIKTKHIFTTTIIITVFGIAGLSYYIATYPHQHISRRTAIKYFRYIKEKNKIMIPEEGVIPDRETAIELARVLLSKKYGKKLIKSQMPFDVHLIDGYWHVGGTLPKGFVGGTGLIIISKKDGHVIHLAHDQQINGCPLRKIYRQKISSKKRA